MNNEILFNNLKNLRTIYELTQIEVANIIGKDRSLIAKYESGKAVPPLNILQAFSKLYNISVDNMCNVEVDINSDVLLTSIKKKAKADDDISFSELSDFEKDIILRLRLSDEEKVNEIYERLKAKK